MLGKLQRLALGAGIVALGDGAAWSAECNNRNALGVSRTIAVNSRAMPLVGAHDYGVTLPLARREVVLTFDDGPRPPYTNSVLKALADECLRATFFVVGRHALAHPHVLRMVRNAGHTIGTHTQNHPLWRMRGPRIASEVEGGIASVNTALGSPGLIAPFFRFPGLFRTPEAERYLRRRGLMVWSFDVDSHDWKRLSAAEIVRQTVAQVERRGRGIILMHDANGTMARALPRLLAELKRRGFRVVHVVPSSRMPDLVAGNAPPRVVRKPAGPRVRKADVRVRRVAARSVRPRGNADVVFTSGFRTTRR